MRFITDNSYHQFALWPLPDTVKANIVYRDLCSYGKLYIRNTKRALALKMQCIPPSTNRELSQPLPNTHGVLATVRSYHWGGVEIMHISSNKTELLVKKEIHIHLFQKMGSSQSATCHQVQRIQADSVMPWPCMYIHIQLKQTLSLHSNYFLKLLLH